MGRFFLKLKMERIWQRNYANPAEAVTDINHYIVGSFNTYRLKSVSNRGRHVASSLLEGRLQERWI